MTKRLKDSKETIVKKYEQLYAKSLYGSRPSKSHSAAMVRALELQRKGAKTALDVGCGRGLLLGDLESIGYDAAGTEVVQSLFDDDLRGRRTYAAMADEIADKVGKSVYDVVFLVDLLDHLPDMREATNAIRAAWTVARRCVIFVVNGESSHKTMDVAPVSWRALLEQNFPGARVSMKVCASKPLSVVVWKTGETGEARTVATDGANKKAKTVAKDKWQRLRDERAERKARYGPPRETRET